MQVYRSRTKAAITRKGYLLNELLVMFPVMLVVMLLCAKSFRVTIVDVPQMYRDFQVNVSISHMLRRLQNDIETSESLTDNAGNVKLEDETLLIESSDGMISYSLGDGKVRKDKILSGENVVIQNVEIWSVPRANINWKIWKKSGKAHAVEVTTSIERKVLGHWQKKLKNSHVYFVGIRQTCSKK